MELTGSENESPETLQDSNPFHGNMALQHTRKILDGEEQLCWCSMPHIQNW